MRSQSIFLLAGLGLFSFSVFHASAVTLPGDTIYVGNASVPAIDTISSSGSASVFAYTGYYPPSALAVDSSGMLYAAMQNNVIYKYDSQGNATLFASSGINTPTALTFDSSGHLFVANADRTIVEFDSQGNPTVFANTGIIQPYGGMAFDNNGNLYAALEGNYTIEKYDSQGNGTLFASVPAPYAMTFHGGFLWVATGTDQIYKFDTLGNATLFASSGLNGPQGLAFGSDGYLYAVNAFDKTITKFDANGNPTLVGTESFYMNSIAIQPVPEPSSWAFFALCGGALAGTRFRRPSRNN